MYQAGYEQARRLAMMAVEETGFGVMEDKVIKNQFAAENVYHHIKNLRTVGIIHEDPQRQVVEIAAPMGVILGIVPTTNPTSTIMYKALIAIKARNTIVFSPHPRAVKCSLQAAKIMEERRGTAGCGSMFIHLYQGGNQRADELAGSGVNLGDRRVSNGQSGL